jgi:AcrR family transcriptional regulator
MVISSRRSTREKILDTALALLTELGYDRLTQPQVAKAAGVSQGHLTYYFPTRSDLLLAVAEQSLRASMAQFLERTEKAAAAPDKVTAIVRQALLDKQRTRTILGLVVASDRDKEIKKPLREMIAHARTLAAALLQALGGKPTRERAILLHACLVGLSVITFALDHTRADKEMGDAAADLLRLIAADRSVRPAARKTVRHPAKAVRS